MKRILPLCSTSSSFLEKPSDECRAEHPKIPWRQIVAMRNIVTHGYDRIDEAKLWEAISVSVPNLIQSLDHILKPD